MELKIGHCIMESHNKRFLEDSDSKVSEFCSANLSSLEVNIDSLAKQQKLTSALIVNRVKLLQPFYLLKLMW